MMDYRHKIFDGNSKISPMFVGLLTIGIIFCGAFPPVGLVMIALALVFQSRFCRKVKTHHRRLKVDERAREQREWLKNFQRDF